MPEASNIYEYSPATRPWLQMILPWTAANNQHSSSLTGGPTATAHWQSYSQPHRSSSRRSLATDERRS